MSCVMEHQLSLLFLENSKMWMCNGRNRLIVLLLEVPCSAVGALFKNQVPITKKNQA